MVGAPLRSAYPICVCAVAFDGTGHSPHSIRVPAKVFKKYSQMKREAFEKINRQANEAKGFDTAKVQ
jgi:hypothetical protein